VNQIFHDTDWHRKLKLYNVTALLTSLKYLDFLAFLRELLYTLSAQQGHFCPAWPLYFKKSELSDKGFVYIVTIFWHRATRFPFHVAIAVLYVLHGCRLFPEFVEFISFLL